MMVRLKRMVSLLLTLTMVVSTMSLGVWADAAEEEAPPQSYTVLVADTSASMAGTPADVQRETALRFCDAVLAAEGDNAVAVVRMGAAPEVSTSFTADPEVLAADLDSLGAEGPADFTAALETAEVLLDAVEEEAEKSIVLFSDGMVSAGAESAEGAYTERDFAEGYTFANRALETAEAIKASGYGLYTLGFFHSLDGNDLTFGTRFLKDLAVDGGFCEVVDAEDVEFVFGEDSEPAPEESGNIRVTGCSYFPSFGGQDFAVTYYYDDDYFAKSAYEYQDSLATMTLCLALSAFGTSRAANDEEGYLHKSQNLENLLSECGFPEENYATNQSFREKPTMDSIGVGASHKTVMDEGEPYTLIAAAIRGGGYESEWASNFTLGETGAHRGFSEARDQVLEFLTEYVADQNITGDIKLWITGYSRAAATTNMVAGALDGGYSLGDAVELDGEDLYAYCYECPQGAGPADDVTAPVYQNIFNILNPGDVVTKIAPTKPDQFGFQRFGVNCYLPTALKEGERYSELQAAMLEKFYELPSTTEYVTDDFQMKKVSISRLFWDPSGFLEEGIIVDNNDEKWDMNAFLDETLYKLFSENVRSRHLYVKYYEEDMRELCRALFGCADKWDDFGGYFTENLEEQSGRIVAYLLLHMDRRALRVVENALTDALSEAGITDYSARQIKQFAVKIVALFLPFCAANPDLTVTLVENLAVIGSAHLPEVCMAWLQSFDPNYTPEGRAAFNSGIHRVVRVNSAVDVYVYDGDGTLVAAIVDGQCQDIADSSIVTFINGEGEKLIYLPADAFYQVELQGTEESALAYSVQEYSEEAGGVNRIVNYYDLTVEDGETYTGYLPNLSRAELLSAGMEGSSTDYVLLAPDGDAVPADDDMSGETAAEANCQVTATSSDEACGVVTGSGVVKAGASAKLTAVTNEGCRFTGWYVDGALVSEDAVYSFCVTEDVAVEGRFEPAEAWEVTFEWAEDHSACTAVLTNGTDVERVSCTITSETTEATADQDGQTVYTATVEFQGVVYADQQTVVLPAVPAPQQIHRPYWVKWVQHWLAGVLPGVQR